MKRTPLSIGSTIQAKGGSSYTYIIDRVIGDGASSIVYEAHYVDHSNHKHYIRLKECYPYQSSIERNGNNLVWSNDNERTNDIAAFKSGYDALMKDQKSNYIVHAFDQFESNNTMYIVMDANEGVTFDKTDFDSLKDILSTIKLLAHIVGEYHKKGYLHLDIKPSNFLVYPRPSEHIVLFDVDSVTAMEDITSGKVKCVSYSKGWAAPEQMQGHIDKLSPATDIFSIGAILFQKVMGRAVENEDIGIFADWDFDGEMYEKVNPKIKRLLREIFHKTIAANAKRRYQSVDELIGAIEIAKRTSEERLYIRSSYPSSMTRFIGRKREMSEIKAAFESNKCVLLQGFMGMGKSSLAIEFASSSKDAYDKICWVKVNNPTTSEKEIDSSIRQALNSYIVNSSQKDIPEDQFIKLLDSNVLIIIDNYDVEKITPYVSQILESDCRLLITTRSNLNYRGSDVSTITLDPLQSEELIELVQEKCGRALTEEELDYAEEFLDAHEHLTYSIVLSAGQMSASCISLQQQLKDVYAQQNDEDVEMDGNEDAIINHYRRRARLDTLSDVELECLRTVFVMSYNITPGTRFVDSQQGVFDRSVFKAYTGLNLNALNKLIKRNLIFEGINGELSLHTSIKTLVEWDWTPTWENCPSLYKEIKQHLDFYPDMSLTDIKQELLDIHGVSHQQTVRRTKELFDIYYYICDGDPQKARFLINLFLLFTKQNMIEEYASDVWFVEQYEDIDIWHFDWDRRNWYACQLSKSVLSESGLQLFDDSFYVVSPPPQYNNLLRALLYLSTVCRSLLRFVHSYYYQEAEGFFIVLYWTLKGFYEAHERSNEYLIAAKELIDICSPMFEHCYPFGNHGYTYWAEESYKIPFGESLEEYPDHPCSPICIHKSIYAYDIYVMMFKILGNALEIAHYPDTNHEQCSMHNTLIRLRNDIGSAINRLCIGYDVFYDFLNPNYQTSLISDEFPLERYDECQDLYEVGFDKEPNQYHFDVIRTLESAKKPFPLYLTLLDPLFPLSNVSYDRLIEADLAAMILKDNRLSKSQKRKLYEEVFWHFWNYEDDWNTMDTKRRVTDKQYSLSKNGSLKPTSNSKNCIEVSHHIVLLWYQILRGLFNEIGLSKQFLISARKEIQSKYVDALIKTFDYDLYQEYEGQLIANIPEFSCPIDTALYELFTQNQSGGRSSDAILANAFYNLTHGLPLGYSHSTIAKAIDKRIDYTISIGKDYNPFENDLLECWYVL